MPIGKVWKMMETPEIKTSSYTSQPLMLFTSGGVDLMQEQVGAVELWEQKDDFIQRFHAREFEVVEKSSESSEPTGPHGPSSSSPSVASSSSSTESMMDRRRLVQVFIVDPDQDLPLENALLYTGEQGLTELTDQELFFEIDIKTILEKHNKTRAKTLDKETMKITGKEAFLDPVRIRDLKMTVVELAVF